MIIFWCFIAESMRIKNPAYMKFFSTFILTFLLCFITGSCFMTTRAQDIHFSQFDFAPIYLNPANTGNFNGDFRIAGNFRSQKNGSVNPYRTATISFDKQFFLLNQKIGVGAFILNDDAGAGELSFNKFYGSLGYNTLIGNNSIGIGLQAGYVYGKVNQWGLFDQWVDGTFTLPSGEVISNANYFDINFGLNYKRNIFIFVPEAGLSLAHINKPKKSFFDDKNEKESMRIMFYSTVKTNINDKLSVTPKFWYSQKDGDFENIFGAEAGYNLIGVKTTVKRVFGGAYARNNSMGFDAILAQVGATVGRLDIGISYDIYMSDITKSGNTNAIEISFIYKSISTILNSYSIPCERY